MVAAALAAFGVPGVSQPVALAGSSSVPDWTKQAPATRPPGLFVASMAYDAATGTAVLFGGESRGDVLYRGTWTWDGTTWTHQHPATRPPAENQAMAYDAATRTVVLFGFGGTWTWDGTTWTQQHPATSPPDVGRGSMAYDAATRTVVLFVDGGTWTWDGTTWTQQHPATSPSLRCCGSMAYDAATGTVVLFGGSNNRQAFNDTWTWDGTTWTQQHPATHPSARSGSSMAYDAATGTVVLFGGLGPGGGRAFNGTWTWDGTTWTKQAPATHPSARWGAAMAYDAATGNAVMFGGQLPVCCVAPYSGTWTWG